MEIMAAERIIELNRQPEKGFGFSVIGGADTHLPPMVCALVKDSPASKSGKLDVGDVLIKVNGTPVEKLSIKEIVSLIRNSPDQIAITVKDDSNAKMKARPFLTDRSQSSPGADRNATLNAYRQESSLRQWHEATLKNSTTSGYPVSNGRVDSYGPPFYVPGNNGRLSQEHSPNLETSRNHHGVPADVASKSSTYPHRAINARRSYNNIKKSPFMQNSLSRDPHVDSFYQSQYRSTSSNQNYDDNDLLDQISGTRRNPSYRKGLLSPMQANRSPNIDYNDRRANNNEVCCNGSSSPRTNGSLNIDPNRIYKRSVTPSQSDGTICNSNAPYSVGHYNQQHSSMLRVENGSYSNAISLSRNAASCDDMDGRLGSKVSVSSIPPSPSSASSTGSFLSNRLPYSSSRIPYDYTSPEQLYMGTYHVPVSYETTPAVTVQERYYNGGTATTPDVNSFDRGGAHRRPIHASPNAEYKEVGQNRSMDSSQGVVSPSMRNYQRGHSAGMTSQVDGMSPNCLQVSDMSESSSFQGMSSNSFDTVDSINNSDSVHIKNVSGVVNQENPAEIAAKLFTLNGYKDKDIAPLLGKNNEFSQRVCEEYLKFFDFRGLGLDEALRVFLKKFPLTGETQERERILIHFSKRHYNCNRPPYGSEDAIHTLTCALMLLNSDLHGQNIGNKMTLQEFITNLSGLCDGRDFPKDLLKSLYQSIKTRQMEWMTAREAKDLAKMSPRSRRKNSAPGNPFVELKVDDNAVVMKEGLMYRKNVMEADGKRTPAIKRGWKLFYGILRGLVLFLYKADHVSCDYPLTIGVHHALAGYANDYKKRPFVFKLITSDWRVFLFQSKSKTDVQEWIDSINMSAAVLSAPPLPAPCSSSKHFQRPVMPVSTTRLPISEQLTKHESQRKEIEAQVAIHRDLQPKPSVKDYKDWENKMDYLDFALKRFSSYVHVLTAPRLKSGVDMLVASRVRATSLNGKNSEPKINGMDSSRRSNSVGDFGTMRSSPQSQRKNSKQRQSYLMAVYP